MGYYYLNGIFVEMDKTKAFEYYKESSEKGDIVAKYNTGMCYYYGWGTVKNTFLGEKMILDAAMSGVCNAMIWMGYRCEEEKSFNEALDWYSKAAARGDTDGKDNYKRLSQRK